MAVARTPGLQRPLQLSMRPGLQVLLSEAGASQLPEQQPGQGCRAGRWHRIPRPPHRTSGHNQQNQPGLRMAPPEGDLIYLNNLPRKQEGSGRGASLCERGH